MFHLDARSLVPRFVTGASVALLLAWGTSGLLPDDAAAAGRLDPAEKAEGAQRTEKTVITANSAIAENAGYTQSTDKTDKPNDSDTADQAVHSETGEKPEAAEKARPLIQLPEEKVPITKWLEENAWRSARDDPSRFEVGGGRLHLVSQGDSVMIGTQRGFPIEPREWPRIRMRLRVDVNPRGADLSKKSGDDAAFRVYVAFDRGGGILSPPNTLAYTWTENVNQDTVIRSAHYKQLRYLSIGSGSTRGSSAKSAAKAKTVGAQEPVAPTDPPTQKSPVAQEEPLAQPKPAVPSQPATQHQPAVQQKSALQPSPAAPGAEDAAKAKPGVDGAAKEAEEPGWVTVERNLLEDYRRVFPEDKAEVPPLTGIVLKCDSNNTETTAAAWLSALELLHPKK